MVRRYISQAKLNYVEESRVRRELNKLERQLEAINRTLDALDEQVDRTYDEASRISKDIDDGAKRAKADKEAERASVQVAQSGKAKGPSNYAEAERQDWHNDDVIFGDV